MNKTAFTFLALLAFAVSIFGQDKMLLGPNHMIMATIPAHWHQVPMEQIPLFLKPDAKNVSDMTYLYVFAMDFNIHPDMEAWISGNTEELQQRFEKVKVDSLKFEFDNFKGSEYCTDKYKTITYEYPNGRKEALLVLECEYTIVTVCLSTKDKKEFKQYEASFLKLIKSLKVMGAAVIEEE